MNVPAQSFAASKFEKWRPSFGHVANFGNFQPLFLRNREGKLRSAGIFCELYHFVFYLRSFADEYLVLEFIFCCFSQDVLIHP